MHYDLAIKIIIATIIKLKDLEEKMGLCSTGGCKTS